jgi:hypothetical protein
MNKQQLHTSAFLMEMQCVFFEVGILFSNIILYYIDDTSQVQF